MTTKKKTENVPGKVVGGPARASYAHVFKPAAIHPDKPDDKKYSVVLMVSKSNKELVKAIKRAQQEALEMGKEKHWGGKLPPANKLKLAIKDGDTDFDLDKNPEYAGHLVFTAKSDRKPTVIDLEKEPLTSDDEFYSGCYTRFSVKFWPFNHPIGGKGISVQLNHLQKVKDGERFGTAIASADEDFEDDWENEDGDDDDDLLG